MKLSQRTKNRIREHKDHGWSIVGTGEVKFTNVSELAHLFDCTCGWGGWLPADEVQEARDMGLMEG